MEGEKKVCFDQFFKGTSFYFTGRRSWLLEITSGFIQPCLKDQWHRMMMHLHVCAWFTEFSGCL